MDFHYEESWCPVCDRQIMPKRFTVPIPQPPPPQPVAPVVPPSSPSLSPLADQQGDAATRTTRSKTGTVRAKGGLARGTGCIRPNGATRRSESNNTKTRTPAPQQQTQPAKPAPPTKYRTVIDQGPIPLYCSDICRIKDLARLNGAFPINYDPNRASPPLPPTPHNSFDRSVQCESEDESCSGSGSSLDSGCSSSSESVPMSPSIATLAALYDFPPLPPAAPILPVSDPERCAEPEYRNDYQSGVMMASKRIQAVLCPDPAPKRSVFNNAAPQPRKPIPGWTDGSDAWRQSVYSFSPRSDSVVTVGVETKASFAASSHRGVQWTTGNSAKASSSSSLPAHHSTSALPPRSTQSYEDELYAKYSLPLSRRSESRTTLFPPPASSASQSLPPLSPTSTSSRRRREIPLVKAGAEGRLLVPNVTLRAHSASSQSLSTGLCSPLSRYPSELSEDSMLSEDSETAAPRPQVRSWSYENVKTYPVMMLPPKKEKRIETCIIDGETKEVEVEVEIVQPLKRLFLFQGKETSPERRW